MMRQNKLRRLANNQLMNDNRGSHRDKQYRHFVIHKVIHDLFHLKKLPNKWHGLTHEHICALVTFWKKKKIAATTLMKYMTVIRYFLKNIDHVIADIDNQTLGIVRSQPKAKASLRPNDFPEKLTHPIAKIIFQLQSEFALTFSEAARIIPDLHIREHSLWITREIAFNHQDRIIPIRNNEQIVVVQSLLLLTNDHLSLISMHGYHAVRHIYRTSMQTAGLDSMKSYRYLYAKHQHTHLLQAFSKQETNNILMREMGLKSRTTLWGYLHE